MGAIFRRHLCIASGTFGTPNNVIFAGVIKFQMHDVRVHLRHRVRLIVESRLYELRRKCAGEKLTDRALSPATADHTAYPGFFFDLSGLGAFTAGVSSSAS